MSSSLKTSKGLSMLQMYVVPCDHIYRLKCLYLLEVDKLLDEVQKADHHFHFHLLAASHCLPDLILLRSGCLFFCLSES